MHILLKYNFSIYTLINHNLHMQAISITQGNMYIVLQHKISFFYKFWLSCLFSVFCFVCFIIIIIIIIIIILSVTYCKDVNLFCRCF